MSGDVGSIYPVETVLFHTELGIAIQYFSCLLDTVFISYRIGVLFTRERFAVPCSDCNGSTVGCCIHCAFCCATLQTIGQLVDLLMRFRIELVPDSTVYTMLYWLHDFMPLSERFHLKTGKRYEAYRIGSFSCRYKHGQSNMK